MTVTVDDRDMVVPGQVLGEGADVTAGDGTYMNDKQVIAKYFGAADVREGAVQVIPHHVRYNPSAGDQVIGEIDRVSISSYSVDIACPYDAFLHVNDAVDEYVDHDDDISQYFDVGDLLVGKITQVTKGKDVNMTMQAENARKLEGGRVIAIPPSKVSRVIGRQGSMVGMIKRATDTMIIIGQNGRVWIEGAEERTAVRAVRTVADNAHKRGLTEDMADWLEDETGRSVEPK